MAPKRIKEGERGTRDFKCGNLRRRRADVQKVLQGYKSTLLLDFIQIAHHNVEKLECSEGVEKPSFNAIIKVRPEYFQIAGQTELKCLSVFIQDCIMQDFLWPELFFKGYTGVLEFMAKQPAEPIC